MRLIDADELKNDFDIQHFINNERVFDIPQIKAFIDIAPTVEAKTVVHGEWHLLDKCSNAGVYCSVCHKKVYKEPYYANVKVKSNFCPNCGADMRKKVE